MYSRPPTLLERILAGVTDNETNTVVQDVKSINGLFIAISQKKIVSKIICTDHVCKVNETESKGEENATYKVPPHVS